MNKKKLLIVFLISIIFSNIAHAIKARAILKKCFTYTYANTIHTIELSYIDGKLTTGHLHTLANNDNEQDYNFEIKGTGKKFKITMLNKLDNACNIKYQQAQFVLTTNANNNEQLVINTPNIKVGKTNSKRRIFVFEKCTSDN
jgi:hypothetical protein